MLTLVFACQVALMFRLHASVPVFGLANRALALAAGQEWRTWAYLMSGLTSLWIGMFSANTLTLLQLRVLDHGTVLVYIFFGLGLVGMFATLFLPTPADHAEADVQPA